MNNEKVVNAVSQALEIEKKDAEDLIKSLNFSRIVELHAAVGENDLSSIGKIFGVKTENMEAMSANAYAVASGSAQPIQAPGQQFANGAQKTANSNVSQNQPPQQQQKPKPGDKVMVSFGDNDEPVEGEIQQMMGASKAKVKTPTGTQEVEISDGMTEMTSAGGVAVAAGPAPKMTTKKKKKY